MARIRCSTVPKTTVFGGAPRLIGAAIGAKVLAAAGLDEMTDEEVAGSYDELLKSAIMAVAQALGRSSGRDVDIEGSHDLEGAPHLDGRSDFSLCFSDQVLQPICFGSLSASDEIENASTTFSDSSDSGRTPCSPAGGPDHNGQPRPATDLERILDLELPLRISFGKATLPLADVLRLTSGSIVQLNRSISDPVEIIVNDRVVGRGEVVVVEGNYGVRISEIVGGDGHGRF